MLLCGGLIGMKRRLFSCLTSEQKKNRIIKMKANEKEILQFLEGSNKHFVIPTYQRNYDWKVEQCNPSRRI